jgi:hypothetical protein
LALGVTAGSAVAVTAGVTAGATARAGVIVAPMSRTAAARLKTFMKFGPLRDCMSEIY